MTPRVLKRRDSAILRRRNILIGLCAFLALYNIGIRLGPRRVQGQASKSGVVTSGARAPDAVFGGPPIKASWPELSARDIFDRSGEDVPTAVVNNESRIKAEATSSLHVSGIVLGDPSWAVINGRIVKPGDAIDQFRVIEIKTRSVVVENQGVTIVLDLRGL